MSIVDLMSERYEELILNEKEDIQSSEETEALPLKKKGGKKKNSKKKKSEDLIKDDDEKEDDDDVISEKSLHKKKVPELKNMCKEADLKKYSKLKKAELIAMLLCN